MTILAWDERFAVGIAEIDRQHQGLVRMINDLHEALVAERGQAALADVVSRMLDYAAHHFITEESLMSGHGYPFYGEHKKEHDAFTLKARDLKRRIENKGFVLSLEVLHFLRDWLTSHILVNDRKYAPFLIAAGVR
jgi:hemerythrin-like metal-binding protein